MIAYVFPADDQGCGHYRLIWPARALRDQGCDVRVVMPDARVGLGGEIDSRTGRLVNVIIPPDADVIVMQRVSFINLVHAIPMIRARGVAVVVDMDDDLVRIDPNNPAFWAMRPEVGSKHHTWRNASAACDAATLVTVSTPALLRQYARCRDPKDCTPGVVIENRIPRRYLDIEHEDSAVIGWPGSTHSHPFDLQEVGFAIARLIEDGVTYRGVGPVEGLRAALGLRADPEVTGAVDMTRWPHELARLGVGIAPLADTVFNSGKSWLKPLELMACGVPWVASPRAEYSRLAKLSGVGLLAGKPKDWLRHLRRLTTDATLRQEMSAKGREWAREATIEGNAWRWWDAWTRALELQRGARYPKHMITL